MSDVRGRIRGHPRTLLFASSSRCSHSDHIALPSNMRRNRARAEPVSCQSCRAKKLKCNRVQPCSNCTTRGITCSFLVPPRGQADTTSRPHSDLGIVERVERLESIVLKRTSSAESDPTCATDNNHDTSQHPLYLRSDSVVVSNPHQARDQDSRFLENVGTREDALVCGLHHYYL